MVVEQLERRGISDQRVLEAMRTVPRECLDADDRKRAFEDIPIQIGWGQTISQPYMVALICEVAAVRPSDRVLDVGTGSGYPGGGARRAGSGGALDRAPPAACRAGAREAGRGGIRRVLAHLGDGSLGDPEHAPFDAITVAAAAPASRSPSTTSSFPGDASSFRSAIGAASASRSWSRARKARRSHSVECRFVPLVRRGGY